MGEWSVHGNEAHSNKLTMTVTFGLPWAVRRVHVIFMRTAAGIYSSNAATCSRKLQLKLATVNKYKV